jgi:hypothetical protein
LLNGILKVYGALKTAEIKMGRKRRLLRSHEEYKTPMDRQLHDDATISVVRGYLTGMAVRNPHEGGTCLTVSGL